MTTRRVDEAEVFGRLFVLGQHLTRRADEALRPVGLTSKQWLLLAVLVKGFPGATPTLTEAAAVYGTSRQNVKQVMIDSLNGYLNAMPEARFLMSQMHELLTFLSQQGVLTFLIVAQHGTLGSGVESPVDLSYLADSVVWLRYFEHAGEVRKAISVMKNRIGPHEPTIREMQITPRGIRVGQPLSKFHGVLTGTPAYHGSEGGMFGGANEPRP